MARDVAREHLGREGPPTSGSLGETDVAALTRIFEAGRLSGVLRLAGPAGAAGTLWFREGRIVDCQAGRRSGEAAFHDVLSWRGGTWTASFEPVDRTRTVALGTQALLVEGARRAEELARVAVRLPPRDRPLEIDFRLLSERLAEIPDEVNGLLRLLDGRRTLGEVLAASDADELAAATAIARLHAEGILRSVAERAASAPSTAAVDWFAGPAGGEPAPAPEEVPPGAPRIVRFPSRRRTSPTPALPVEALELPRAGPEPRRLPPEPPVEPEPHDEPPMAPLARPEARGAVAGAVGPRRRRGVATAAAAVAVIAAGVAVWRAEGTREERPALPPTAALAAADGSEFGYVLFLESAQRRYLAGDFLGAAADYRSALALRETSTALFGLGRALSGADQPGAALEALRRAVAVDAGNAEAYIALGEVYLGENRLDEARGAYRRYLEIAPTGEQAGDARAALARLK